MAARAVRPATYQDVLDAPEHLVAELIDGELFLSPRPRFGHGVVMSYISALIGSGYGWGRGGPGGWWIVGEPELHLGNNALVPDLGGWRRERLPENPGDLVGIKVSPDWVCEVISPSTGYLDRAKKLPKYAKHGIPWAWIVDPNVRTLEVFRLDGAQWVLHASYGGDNEVAAEPFTEVTLNLAEMWVGPAPE